MPKQISMSQMRCFAKTIRNTFEQNKERVALAEANEASAFVQRRIFNEGMDANGRPISYSGGEEREQAYSRGHARKRRSNGRQIGKVDLQLTDELFRSLGVSQKGRNAVFGVMRDARQGKIGNSELIKKLEELYKQEIFSLSDKEADRVTNAVAIQMEKIWAAAIDACL